MGKFTLLERLFEFLHIDHVGPLPPVGPGKDRFLLTVIDRASNYVWAIPVPDTSAETTAKALVDRVLCMVGVPKTICLDKGPAFDNELMTRLAE